MAVQKIIVYTSESCPYCVRAKALLKERGVTFEEIMIPWDDNKRWDELTARSGMLTVPQIFAGDRLIGGYAELASLDTENQLQSLK